MYMQSVFQVIHSLITSNKLMETVTVKAKLPMVYCSILKCKRTEGLVVLLDEHAHEVEDLLPHSSVTSDGRVLQ